jgi:hypothetical protein
MSKCPACNEEHGPIEGLPKLINKWLADTTVPTTAIGLAKAAGVNEEDIAKFIFTFTEAAHIKGYVNRDDYMLNLLAAMGFGFWLATRGPKQ